MNVIQHHKYRLTDDSITIGKEAFSFSKIDRIEILERIRLVDIKCRGWKIGFYSFLTTFVLLGFTILAPLLINNTPRGLLIDTITALCSAIFIGKRGYTIHGDKTEFFFYFGFKYGETSALPDVAFSETEMRELKKHIDTKWGTDLPIRKRELKDILSTFIKNDDVKNPSD